MSTFPVLAGGLLGVRLLTFVEDASLGIGGPFEPKVCASKHENQVTLAALGFGFVSPAANPARPRLVDYHAAGIVCRNCGAVRICGGDVTLYPNA